MRLILGSLPMWSIRRQANSEPKCTTPRLTGRGKNTGVSSFDLPRSNYARGYYLRSLIWHGLLFACRLMYSPRCGRSAYTLSANLGALITPTLPPGLYTCGRCDMHVMFRTRQIWFRCYRVVCALRRCVILGNVYGNRPARNPHPAAGPTTHERNIVVHCASSEEHSSRK